MNEPADDPSGLPPLAAAPPTEPVPTPAQNPFSSRPRPRPYWGPFLWTYGSVLWAYLVLGQYTTDHLPLTSPEVPLGGVSAALLFMLAAGTALVLSLRTTRAIPSRFGVVFRGVAVFFFTLFAWWATLLFSLVLGSAFGSSSNAPVTLTLFALAVGCLALGRKLSRPYDWTRTREQRLFVLGLWILGVLLSLPVLPQL